MADAVLIGGRKVLNSFAARIHGSDEGAHGRAMAEAEGKARVWINDRVGRGKFDAESVTIEFENKLGAKMHPEKQQLMGSATRNRVVARVMQDPDYAEKCAEALTNAEARRLKPIRGKEAEAIQKAKAEKKAGGSKKSGSKKAAKSEA